MRQVYLLIVLLILVVLKIGAAGTESATSLKPVITYREAPQYTPEALEAGIHGVVLLSLVLYSNGTIGNIMPLTELPAGLTQAAIDTAYQIRFKPGQKNGNLVSVRMAVGIPFRFDYVDAQRLQKGLSFAFPHLTKDVVDNLVKRLDPQQPDSMAADLWVLFCDQQGTQLLSAAERKTYLELKCKAINLLPDATRLRVAERRTDFNDDQDVNADRMLLQTLVFDGIRRASIEKQKQFVTLHNKAVRLGLQKVQEK